MAAIPNEHIKWLARGPSRIARNYPGYFVKGYRFHTKSHSANRATDNSGVCIKGSYFGTMEEDYYGVLDEILELEYSGTTTKRTVVFNCTWFQTISQGGTRIHLQLKIVDVNKTRKMRTPDRYVLAQQATQVYYLQYPYVRRSDSDWLAVCKVKSRVVVEYGESEEIPGGEDAYQDNNATGHHVDDGFDLDPVGPLNDPDNTFVHIEDLPLEDQAEGIHSDSLIHEEEEYEEDDDDDEGEEEEEDYEDDDEGEEEYEDDDEEEDEDDTIM